MEIERIGILDDVFPEDFLELNGGIVVKNLGELVVALEKMSDEDFGMHVYGEQNDFAEWVMEAYWDDKLAGKLLSISDRRKMIKFLKDVLNKAEKGKYKKIGKISKKKDVLREIGSLE
jgi:hypothetical protein